MKPSRTITGYALLALLVIVGASLYVNHSPQREKLRLDEYRQQLAAGEVRSVELADRTSELRGELRNGRRFKVGFPHESADELTTELLEAKVPLKVDAQRGNAWISLLINALPFIMMVIIFLWLMNAMQGGGSRLMQFGKAKPKIASKDQPRVTFSDVAGCDEAVEELREIKDFLANPGKFIAIGAKIPKGVLLYGPPGTGKTLLAKAVAGEAGVPFFSISGSDFVEMFVGVGASRVRDLFEQAKSSAPAIIFVDEIDAVGRHRGAGLGGGHDEREQTLNQLLVEMDGFDTRTGVILIAATNRPDILDPALLRPGRFDRQIVVDRPDIEGRRAILRVHAAGKPLGHDVNLDVLARRTPGFTGADIANLLNESALFAARRSKHLIGMAEVEAAIDRVIAGPERKTKVMSEDERRVIAYHEAGHALVGHVLPGTDDIHKISIVARGRSLGWTLSLPERDKYLVTRSALRDELAMLLGGRTAEELMFSESTTGAQNDIERATAIARSMVTEFGMSDQLGPVQLGQRGGEVFLGRDFSSQPNYSEDVASRIDHEVRRLIDAAHATASEILTAHRAVLDAVATKLLDVETLESEEIAEMFRDLPQWTKSPDASVLPGRGIPAEIEPVGNGVDHGSRPRIAATERSGVDGGQGGGDIDRDSKGGPPSGRRRLRWTRRPTLRPSPGA